MLGFSVPKILLLIFIIFLIWYGFKMLERRSSSKIEKEKEKESSSKYTEEDVQDLEKCLKCGNYFMSGSTCTECGSSK